MKSDMEKMQEELDTQDQLRKQQEDQVVHNKHLFITSDFLFFIALIWKKKMVCSLCMCVFQLTKLEEMLKKLEDEAMERKSQLEQVQDRL